MHQGEDTDFYLTKGFRVVGFEADPDLAEGCRRRFAAALKSKQLTIVEGAIVPAGWSGAVTFYKNPNKSVWGTTNAQWMRRNALHGMPSVAIEVAPVDFAEALATFGVPYYCKIDVEGVDRLCLETLGQFTVRPRFVSIESEYTSLPALLAEFRAFRALGYRRFAVVQQADIGGELRLEREGRPITYGFVPGSSGPFGDDLTAPWKGLPATLLDYLPIVARDRLLADPPDGLRSERVVAIRQSYEKRFGRLGWYDTHARLD